MGILLIKVVSCVVFMILLFSCIDDAIKKKETKDKH